MKQQKYFQEWDREKKIRKIDKSNKVVKHRKIVYDYDDEDDFDYVEQLQYEAEQYLETK